MITRDYIIKNVELACVGVDEPAAAIAGTTPKYAVTIILSEEVANGIRYLVKEVADAAFGSRAKELHGLDKVKFDETAGAYKLTAVSSEKPKIVGIPYSKGLKLNLIRQADIKIAIWSYANSYGKGVGIELKELIFNHQPQPQPTGEQKCL